jgi:hypothetical protein
MRRQRTLVWLIPVVLLALLLPGCFTSALWGTDLDGDSSTTDATYERKQDLSIWTKILLTPFAILLDALTSPVQEFLGDDDEEDEPGRRRAVCR